MFSLGLTPTAAVIFIESTQRSSRKQTELWLNLWVYLLKVGPCGDDHASDLQPGCSFHRFLFKNSTSRTHHKDFTSKIISDANMLGLHTTHNKNFQFLFFLWGRWREMCNRSFWLNKEISARSHGAACSHQECSDLVCVFICVSGQRRIWGMLLTPP